MQVVKKKMLNGFSRSFESAFAINNIIGKSNLDFGFDYISNYENIVNSMTAQDLVNAAAKYLDLNKTAITVVHPSSATPQSISSNYSGAISFTGNATSSKKAINMDNVTEYRAANNFKIITNDIPTRNSYLSVDFACDKPIQCKPAARFILNNLLNEGSMFKTQLELDKNLEKNGISSKMYADDENIGGIASCDVNDLQEALRNFREVIQNPRFQYDAFLQAKSDLREDLLRAEKNAFENLQSEIFKGMSEGYTNKEILDSIDSVTMEDVRELHKYVMENSKAVVTVSAPFSKQTAAKNTLFNEIAQFGVVKEFNPYIDDTFKPTAQTKVITEADNKNQATIYQSYKFEVNKNLKDTVTIDLLNQILGGGPSSRLFSDLRETQKLAYSVRSNNYTVDNSGVLNLSIGTTTENNETGEVSYDNVQKAINGFNKHISKMLTEKVSAEELNSAKLSAKNTILSNTETPDDEKEALTSSAHSVYGNDYANKYLEMVDQITADDILTAAKYIFSNKPTYSIVATENTLKYNENYFKSLEN